MKFSAIISGAILATITGIHPLFSQTNSLPTHTAPDPLVVSAELSREVEGSPGSGDQVLTLDECLTRVFSTNPTIQQQKALIENAADEKLVFRSRAFPRINVGAVGGQQGPRDGNDAKNFAILTGSLVQPLFEASIPAAFRRGSAGVVAAGQNFQSQAVQILHAARLDYYNALAERATLKIFDELQKPLSENVKMEKDLVTAGLSARSSVIQAEIRKLQLVPGREAARQRYHESLVLLAERMGANLKESAAVQLWPRGPLPYMPVSFNLSKATEEALKNRPDLQLMRSMIVITEEDRRIARAGYYPRVNLVATAQYLPQSVLSDSNSSRPGEDTRNSEFLIGPAYTWQIIDTGRVTGSSLSLEAARESYEIQLTELEQDVPRNLSEIYRALDLAQKRIASLSASVKLAEENLAMVQDLISLNEANQLDFVNARNSLLQTKLGMINAFRENSIALANLDLATGRYLRYVDSEDRKK